METNKPVDNSSGEIGLGENDNCVKSNDTDPPHTDNAEGEQLGEYEDENDMDELRLSEIGEEKEQDLNSPSKPNEEFTDEQEKIADENSASDDMKSCQTSRDTAEESVDINRGSDQQFDEEMEQVESNLPSQDSVEHLNEHGLITSSTAIANSDDTEAMEDDNFGSEGEFASESKDRDDQESDSLNNQDMVEDEDLGFKDDLSNAAKSIETNSNREEPDEKTTFNMPESAEDKISSKENKTKISTESAFQRLASLGVITEEKPVEESKESVLKKLQSRGAISIVSTSGSSLIAPSGSSISITPTKPKSTPKYKPGPKSALLKQKAKKIKIDPGNSMDIDKDFNSLINILSSAADESQTKSISKPNAPDENDKIDIKLTSVPQRDKNAKHEPDRDNNYSCLVTNTNDVVESGMEVDGNDDRSMLETDSESHDGSKTFSHSSDHADENDERVSVIVPKKNNVIEEGSAEILLSSTKNVFYNPVQEFNRDMSIAALTVFSEMHQQDPRTRNRGRKRKEPESTPDSNGTNTADENVFEPGIKSENGITILEALSATGLRSIRYAREVPGVKEIIANDLSSAAVDSINKNIVHNGVGDMVTTTMSDAALLMYQHQAGQEWYDAIDLDPYGCPSRFLDSAVQAVRDGGLLLVTCTDMAVLAGNAPESCYVKYGAISMRSPACHEIALRITLQCIESHANRYGRYIEPLLSFSADFYIRVIVQVYTSPVTCKRTTSKLSMVYQCVGCQSHALQMLGQLVPAGGNNPPKFCPIAGPPVNTKCFHCQHKHFMGGPIWSAPMYNTKFLESMLKVVEKGRFGTSKRMQGMLEVIREELADVPLYYTISGLCTKLHCQAIPLIDIRSAILNAGYRVSSSHICPTAIKTNAPTKIIWDIMRCWVHMNPVSQKRLQAGSVSATIILEPPNLIANFDIHPKARPSSSMRKLLRYQPNPEKNWGPGMRARCNNTEEGQEDKRRLNQNKNKSKVVKKKNIEIIEVVTIDDEDDGSTAATTSTT